MIQPIDRSTAINFPDNSQSPSPSTTMQEMLQQLKGITDPSAKTYCTNATNQINEWLNQDPHYPVQTAQLWASLGLCAGFDQIQNPATKTALQTIMGVGYLTPVSSLNVPNDTDSLLNILAPNHEFSTLFSQANDSADAQAITALYGLLSQYPPSTSLSNMTSNPQLYFQITQQWNFLDPLAQILLTQLTGGEGLPPRS